MKKNHLIILLILTLLIFNLGTTAQNEYKIIDEELKGKIEYDNAKKKNEIERTPIFYLYQIKISNKIEVRENMDSFIQTFSKDNNLVENSIDYSNNTLFFVSKYNLSKDVIKADLAKHNYRIETIEETFGLKD